MNRKVAVVGRTALDIIFAGPPASAVSQVINYCDSINLCHGGAAFNVARTAKYLGAETTLYTWIGDDIHGREMTRKCKTLGIAIEKFRASKGQSSACIAIHLDEQKERTFIVPKNNHVLKEIDNLRALFTPAIIKKMADNDVVVFAGIPPVGGFAKPALGAIINEIKHQNPSIKVVFDVLPADGFSGQVWRNILDCLLKSSHWFLPSDRELTLLTSDEYGKSNLCNQLDESGLFNVDQCVWGARWLLRAYDNLELVAVKLGDKGSLVVRKSLGIGGGTSNLLPELLNDLQLPDNEDGEPECNIFMFSAVASSEILDKTGAGDAWVGGFVVGDELVRKGKAGSPMAGSSAVGQSGVCVTTEQIVSGGKAGTAAASRCINYIGATSWCDDVKHDLFLDTVDAVVLKKKLNLDP